jgi:RNA polymerase sigma-70 factor (ECF subfamily)
MSPEDSFVELMRRVRARDGRAAEDLLRRYEPAVRRIVRIRLRPNMRRTLDSMDICQSIFESFFVRVNLGQYELNTPEDLRKLLAIMARNKVITRGVRPPHVHKHQEPPPRDGDSGAAEPASPEADPGRQAEARDLLEAAYRLLTDEERWLAEQRAGGRAWNDIAAELGASAEALRKKHDRAIARVSQELGLEDLSAE